MMRGKAVLVLVVAALLLGGCSSYQGESGEAITSEEFYDAMKVGDFASFTEEQLDKVAQGLCSDLANLEEDEQEATVLVLRESVDTEQQAFEVGQAMTGRWCPEYVGAFDY